MLWPEFLCDSTLKSLCVEWPMNLANVICNHTHINKNNTTIANQGTKRVRGDKTMRGKGESG